MEPLKWQQSPYATATLAAWRQASGSYTRELGEIVCALIASGKSLKDACGELGVNSSMISSWIAEDAAGEFRGMYERAMRARTLVSADEMMQIADDARNDYMEVQGRNGETFTKVDTEAIMRSKLRVEVRERLARRFLPSIYGDENVGDANSHKVTVNINTTPIGNPPLPGEPGAQYVEEPRDEGEDRGEPEPAGGTG